MGESAKNRRENAAQARGAMQSAEKRRERIVRIVGGVTVVAVMAGIVGVAVFASSQESNDASSGTSGIVAPDPEAVLPAGVLGADSDTPYGVPYGTATGAPVLELWEDFQCPACGALEVANGLGIEQLATDGQIQLIYRPTAFLDSNLGNDSSHRAISAWGCAIDQGKLSDFHNLVFANQPVNEGTGWTDDQLIDFGSQTGLVNTELEAFTQCVNDGTYLGWAANSTDQFYTSSIPGTPAGYLDGEIIETGVLADQAALIEYLGSK